LINAFHACDVFVLPSVHEPFGIVVLEAWSCRKPVLVSRVGGLRHLVKDGQTGLFFEPALPMSPDVIARQLAALKANPAQCRQIGEAGFSEARNKYDWSVVGQRQEEAYQAAEERSRQK
jgi:glycosyltransferase involved in cell wall biosynthesis